MHFLCFVKLEDDIFEEFSCHVSIIITTELSYKEHKLKFTVTFQGIGIFGPLKSI